jgi:putative ABC transport system permease protein
MRLYSLLLYLFPPSFRRAHGRELLQVARTASARGDITPRRIVADLLQASVREWLNRRPRPERRPRGSVMQDVIRDLRYGARRLVKQPGFTLAAVLTLALGIGANTAMFSLADATLLRPVNVAQPDRLVSWTWTSAYPHYIAYTTRDDVFRGVMAWSGGNRLSVAMDDRTELTSTMFVSGNAFQVLGVTAAAGRVLLPADDVVNGPIVGVLSFDHWRSRFGADPAVIGRLLRINEQPVTIVGVAQEGFRGITLGTTPGIYVPVTAAGPIRGGIFNSPDLFATDNFVWLNVVARLRDDVTRAQASAAVDAHYRQINPPLSGERMAPLTLTPMTTRALGGDSPETIERFVLLLVAVVALTLLIGCANLANLLIAHSATRRHEVGLRLAVGATRGRVLRQMLIESALLTTLGGVAGLAVASTMLRLLGTYQLPGGVDIETLGLSLNRWTLLATAGLSLVTGLLCGAAPAWQGSRTDPVTTLGEQTRSVSGSFGARGLLVGVQIAISLVLLAGSALFLRGLVRALELPTGLNPEGVMAASVNPGLVRYEVPQARAFYADVLERIRALPGVTAAAWTAMIPSNGSMSMNTAIAGLEADSGRAPEFYASLVGPDYFAAVGTRVLSGRGIAAQDIAGAPAVAVISRTAADTFWPGRDPLGAELRPDDGAWRTIVGVVEDVTLRELGETPVPFVYYAFDQQVGGLARGPGPAHLVVRTEGAATAQLGTLAAQIRSVDARVPVYDVMPFSDHVRELVMPQRMGAMLFTIFSAVAVSLAAIGIYGIAAHAAALRTREIGIRLALGAERGDIRRMVFSHAFVPALWGIPVGIGLAAWAAEFARVFLHDVTPRDPWTFGAVGALLAALALAATWLPARRAARLDPVVALREQ